MGEKKRNSDSVIPESVTLLVQQFDFEELSLFITRVQFPDEQLYMFIAGELFYD